jgi:hypothetical protein
VQPHDSTCFQSNSWMLLCCYPSPPQCCLANHRWSVWCQPAAIAFSSRVTSPIQPSRHTLWNGHGTDLLSESALVTSLPLLSLYLMCVGPGDGTLLSLLRLQKHADAHTENPDPMKTQGPLASLGCGHVGKFKRSFSLKGLQDNRVPPPSAQVR